MKYSGFSVSGTVGIFRVPIKVANGGGVTFTDVKLYFDGVMLALTIDFVPGAGGEYRAEC